jgi:arylamine N-acetyltransferase
MAYPNNYFNSYYQPQYPVQQTVQPTQQNNGITWVQGENSAKSYPVAPGQSILLMDSEDSVFYIKSTDQSGMPSPLRIFDYTERKNNAAINNNIATHNEVDYISRSEFDAFKSEIQSAIKQSKQNNNSNMKRTTKEE